MTNWSPVGEGTWGVVFKANYHGPAAVKKLKCKNPSREQIQEFKSEVSILSNLRHNQIVLFMAYILNPPDDMCIVMSWCESSLYKRIHIGQTNLSVKEAMRISKEISQVKSPLSNFCQTAIRAWSTFTRSKLFIAI